MDIDLSAETVPEAFRARSGWRARNDAARLAGDAAEPAIDQCRAPAESFPPRLQSCYRMLEPPSLPEDP